METGKPSIKVATIITVIIFAQKFYRNPQDFSFILEEGLTTYFFGIIGLLFLFGGVMAFVYLGLAIFNEIINKIKS